MAFEVEDVHDAFPYWLVCCGRYEKLSGATSWLTFFAGGAADVSRSQSDCTRLHRWLCARGMNDALHGREAWRPPGKRDRGRRREVGSRVSAHHGPGEATLTPS